MAAKPVTVEFITAAQVRGREYRKGQVAELDRETAQVYQRTRQCKLLPDAPTTKEREPQDKDKPKPANRKTVKRAGKRAETSSDDGRETR